MPSASNEGRLRNGDHTVHRRQTDSAQKAAGLPEIAPDFAGVDPGFGWEDTKFSFSHFFDWERGALVTDVGWMSRATKFGALLMPGEWRTFPTAEAAKAREWIVEPQQ